MALAVSRCCLRSSSQVSSSWDKIDFDSSSESALKTNETKISEFGNAAEAVLSGDLDFFGLTEMFEEMFSTLEWEAGGESEGGGGGFPRISNCWGSIRWRKKGNGKKQSVANRVKESEEIEKKTLKRKKWKKIFFGFNSSTFNFLSFSSIFFEFFLKFSYINLNIRKNNPSYELERLRLRRKRN